MPLTTDVYSKAANFQAQPVLVNPDSVNAPLTFNLFSRQLTDVSNRDNARITFLSSAGFSLTSIELVPEAPTMIYNYLTNTLVASMSLVLGGKSAELIYYAAKDAWYFKQQPNFRYKEVWTATPIVDLPVDPATQPILWTIEPLFIGQVSSLFSYNVVTGVFTSTLSGTQVIDITLKTETLAVLANNEDAIWQYAPVFTGAGLNKSTRIIGPFQSSRIANFPDGQYTLGSTVFVPGDTIKWDASSVGSGQADLTVGQLTFTLEP